MRPPITANNQGRKLSPLWITSLVVSAITALVIAFVIWETNSNSDASLSDSDAATVVQEGKQPDFTDVETRSEEDPLVAGPVDAPVALVVFSDYQCPFCALWSDQTLPAMMDHVADGDLRIEWRDLNVYGPASERAARASYAAALQGQFWAYHGELFANGKKRPKSELSKEALVDLADDIGLDTDQFVADMESEETSDVIATKQQSGFDVGAVATPVFVLDGQAVVGAQSTDVFEQMFTEALEAAE